MVEVVDSNWRVKGCRSTTCDAAAEEGHFEVLKWARANKCDFGFFTTERGSGNLEMMKCENRVST